MKEFKPETYWEDRCHVLEGYIFRACAIIESHLPATRPQFMELNQQWNKILDDLEKEYGEKK